MAQPTAFIQQRIRHVYRRQWPTPNCMAKSRHQLQLGLDDGLSSWVKNAQLCGILTIFDDSGWSWLPRCM
jgi:hypothetical protein